MFVLKAFIICLFVTSGASASAATRPFQIFSYRQVTSQVDRLYGRDGNAFATVFCRADAAEVMFVDSRVPELDGKSFSFGTPRACFEARAKIRSSYRRCVTALVLNTQAWAAQVSTSKCH